MGPTSLGVSALLGLLLLSANAAASAEQHPWTWESATAVIRETLPTAAAKGDGVQDQCASHACCDMDTDAAGCALTDMPRDETTLVLPRGDTQCIFGDEESGPFMFQVIPGDADKVVLFSQGGGACWDERSTNPIPLCSTSAVPTESVGIFDREDERNPFRQHTIVQVLYCSGDVHGGDAARDYTSRSGSPVVQKGHTNYQAALDWLVAQQQQQQDGGALASPLSELIVMGCSAGSVGAQLWAQDVLTNSGLKYTKSAVIPDSYAGVFPDGSQGPLIYNYGYCPFVQDNADLYDKCMNEELTLQDIMESALSTLKDTPFTFVNSKADAVQQAFYVAIALTETNDSAYIDGESYYADVNAIFEEYDAHDNFLAFLVTSHDHCYTPDPAFYTADPTSPVGGGADDQPLLSEWLGSLPLESGDSAGTECDGDSLDQADWSGWAYCDSALVGKEYQQA